MISFATAFMRPAAGAARAIRSRAAGEGGFSLIELLVASSLMIVVLSAVLFTFERLVNNSNAATIRYDSQDRARVALDRLARDLRNASGVTIGAQEIDLSNPDDLVFRTVNPVGPANSQNPTNLERVRYCLDKTNPADELLDYQVQILSSTTPTVASVPDTSACPGSGWNSTTQYAAGITNYNGASRPVFSYVRSNGVIVNIHTDLFVNATTHSQVPETHLASGVFLRNEDIPPTAMFTATPGPGSILLDGSASTDAANQTLTYQWFDGSQKIGTGVVFNYNGLQSGYTCQCQLKVFDPAGLEGDAAVQSVTTQ